MKYIIVLCFLFIAGSFCQTEKQHFFVFLNTNPDREELPQEEIMRLQEGHMANINRLAEEGKLLTAGPVKGGGGIFILSAESLDEANQYLQTDPAISVNRFILEVYPIEFLHGKLCKVDTAGFNMVSYTIIRHTNGEDPITESNDILLLQLNLGGTQEGISILNYDIDKNGAEDLKAILNEAYSINYIKTIWVGEGSFCEN